jgi:hypothetical protein
MAEPQTSNRTEARLGRAIRALLPLRRASGPRPVDISARLEWIERDLGEVRWRVNALFFAVLTTAVGALIERMVLA